MMQYGKLRMISIIYPKEVNMVLNRKSMISSGEFARLNEGDISMDG